MPISIASGNFMIVGFFFLSHSFSIPPPFLLLSLSLSLTWSLSLSLSRSFALALLPFLPPLLTQPFPRQNRTKWHVYHVGAEWQNSFRINCEDYWVGNKQFVPFHNGSLIALQLFGVSATKHDEFLQLTNYSHHCFALTFLWLIHAKTRRHFGAEESGMRLPCHSMI